MRIIALAAAIGVVASLPAFAQSGTTTIIERPMARPPAVVIEERQPPAVIERRTTETTETTGTVTEPGCTSTTVRKEGILGDAREVTRKSC